MNPVPVRGDEASLLEGAVDAASHQSRHAQIAVPPVPSVSELLERLASREPADPILLLPRISWRPRRSRFDENGALELIHTPRGVRARDADATHLVLFRVARGSLPVLLAQVMAARPGVGIELRVEPDAEISLVALSMCEPSEVWLWQIWLTDVFRKGVPTDLPLGSAKARLHGAILAGMPRHDARE